jgi:RNA polymerase sigma-70 factor (ECF subfamily)
MMGDRGLPVVTDRGVEMNRDLVERARDGDREAFTTLVHQVSDTLYSVAFRILRDTGLAEDALQNALVLAWRQLPHLREVERFDAWIHRILVHACYDEVHRSRHWTANVRVLPIGGLSTPDETSAVAARDEIEGAFRRLPVDQRAVFVLHHHLGLTLVEIAEILGIPAGTARSRLHYATRGLRGALIGDAELALQGGRPA